MHKKTNTVMSNDTSKYVTKKTNQGQCHAHDNRGEDEIEGGDLQHVAVRVRVCVDILILSRHVQRFGTIILVSILEKKAEINRAALIMLLFLESFAFDHHLPALRT